MNIVIQLWLLESNGKSLCLSRISIWRLQVPSNHLSAYLSVYLPTYLSIYLSIFLLTHLLIPTVISIYHWHLLDLSMYIDSVRTVGYYFSLTHSLLLLQLFDVCLYMYIYIYIYIYIYVCVCNIYIYISVYVCITWFLPLHLMHAEQAGRLCRDDSDFGMRFYPNLFLQSK